MAGTARWTGLGIRRTAATSCQLLLAPVGRMPWDLPVQTVLKVDRFGLRRDDGFGADLPELLLEEGQVAALYGPSGVGKTSLLEAMFGLSSNGVSAGSVQLLGHEFGQLSVSERQRMLRASVSWVMQDAQAALDPLQPVGDQLRQATYQSLEACAAALSDLGVADALALARRLPHAISGGQAQRALLAVALLRRPRLLIADEPSASLDAEALDLLVTQLRQLQQQGTAILLATHDQRLLGALRARVLLARDGVFAPGRPAPRRWPRRVEGAGLGEVPLVRVRRLRVRL